MVFFWFQIRTVSHLLVTNIAQIYLCSKSSTKIFYLFFVKTFKELIYNKLTSNTKKIAGIYFNLCHCLAHPNIDEFYLQALPKCMVDAH